MAADRGAPRQGKPASQNALARRFWISAALAAGVSAALWPQPGLAQDRYEQGRDEQVRDGQVRDGQGRDGQVRDGRERPGGPDANDLPAILVTAPASADRAFAPQLAVPLDLITDRQPRSAADILRGLGGVSVRTNSRGETIARIRGADERQTQVFLDGAPLAVPWDGRIDLGLLPAGLVGGVRVVKGAAPIEYGANAVAGVVDFQTRQFAQGRFAHLEGGTLGSGSGSLVLAERLGAIEAVLAGGAITRDAEPVAGPLPFSQPSDKRRTNTDLDAGSLFAALGTKAGDLTVRASILHLGADRGIAPESDRPPEAGPRFWRYADIALTQATLGAALALGDAQLRAVGWRQWFGQTIEQYRSVDYTTLSAAQRDDDDTLGARLALSHPLGPLTLRWAASAQSSTHAQVDTDFPQGAPAPSERFRQNLYSAGLEADAPLAPGVRLTLGGAYDRAETPLTGGRPAQDSFAAAAGSAALAVSLGEDAVLTLSGGRRSRFPTARELYGAALGRFAINPELAPERAWLADAELRWQVEGFTLVVNPFLIRSQDTLAQRVLGDGRRQRFNLSGATSYGVDALVARDLTRALRFELTGTALSARADEGTADFRRLPQRPSFEALAALDWYLPERFDLRAELRTVGKTVDLDAEGAPVRLPAATEIALRAAVPVARVGTNGLWLTFAIDNLTDAQIFPQAGLPLPGRVWRVGVRLD